MKGLKYLCLFVLYPVIFLGSGFLGGMICMQYFYPGESFLRVREEHNTDTVQRVDLTKELDSAHDQEIGKELTMDEQYIFDQQDAAMQSDIQDRFAVTQDQINVDSVPTGKDSDRLISMQEAREQEMQAGMNSQQVSALPEVLYSGTAYVLEETDLRNDTVVETTWKLPAKYVGMDRDAFVQAMEEYEATPPLEELERGFVSLEVLSFSREKVVVQMNYQYVQPGNSFYLKVINNYVVVYLEDKETVFMDTDILLKDLPDDMQQDIIHVMYIPDEESLYDFLENYSS